MNNKGFTLIELLATIIILGIVSTVTIVSVISYYEKSKEKAVSAFEKNIEDYIESYNAMYGSKLSYEEMGKYQKCYMVTNNGTSIEKCDDVTLSNTSMKFNELYNKNITDSDVINPSTNVKCENEEIKIYRDSDYVYCFIMETSDSICNNNKINICKNKYKLNGEYIFNEE